MLDGGELSWLECHRGWSLYIEGTESPRNSSVNGGGQSGVLKYGDAALRGKENYKRVMGLSMRDSWQFMPM